MSGAGDAFLTVVSWEYQALKDEIRQCYQNVFQILAWGTTFLATGIGLAARYLPHQMLWLLFIPPVLFTLYIGELHRINRAARYLRFINEKVNRYLDSLPNRDWCKPCDKAQASIEEIEKRLGVSDYGYDFREPLYWEQWLAKMRGRGATAGHAAWIYAVQAGVFPGAFFAIIIIWASINRQPGYCYLIAFGVLALWAAVVLLVARRLQLR